MSNNEILSQEHAEDPSSNLFCIREVSLNVNVLITRQTPPLASLIETEVEAIWCREKVVKPDLFNGLVFSVDRISSDRIDGHWTEYRRIVARMRRPDLASALAANPLAVAGILEIDRGIVIGRRPASALYQPGLWQLAPAGSVDPHCANGDEIDLALALSREMEEELGLSPRTVTIGKPTAMVRHAAIDIFDIAIMSQATISETELRHAHTSRGDGEYPEIKVIPREDLANFLAKHATSVAPQVIPMLRAAGLLPPSQVDDEVAGVVGSG